MNIFIQGMRRSGTTILFDILSEDSELDCYYEPFAAAVKESIGGGSGMHKIDFFDKIKKLRNEFIVTHPELLDKNFLNYGAPRDPTLEFENDLPDMCKQYLQLMLTRNTNTVIKFTRVYNKINELYDLEPRAKLIHIVRSPKAVATSYLYGKNKKNAERFMNNNLFFTKKTNRTPWSSYDFSEIILQNENYPYLNHDLTDLERILLVWKYTFNQTHQSGSKCFGSNYLLLSHDSLIEDTLLNIRNLYTFLDKELPIKIIKWAQHNINPIPNIHDAKNIAWENAFKKIDLTNELKILSDSNLH